MDAFFDIYFGTIGFYSFFKFVLLLSGVVNHCQGIFCG